VSFVRVRSSFPLSRSSQCVSRSYSSSTSKPSWSYEIVLPSEEDGPRGPAGHRLPPRPWTEDEDIVSSSSLHGCFPETPLSDVFLLISPQNFARFIASKRHLDAAAWSEYHASVSGRVSLSLFSPLLGARVLTFAFCSSTAPFTIHRCLLLSLPRQEGTNRSPRSTNQEEATRSESTLPLALSISFLLSPNFHLCTELRLIGSGRWRRRLKRRTLRILQTGREEILVRTTEPVRLARKSNRRALQELQPQEG
jgi:hypothetical protein